MTDPAYEKVVDSLRKFFAVTARASVERCPDGAGWRVYVMASSNAGTGFVTYSPGIVRAKWETAMAEACALVAYVHQRLGPPEPGAEPDQWGHYGK
jgi:hypothetical protein